MASSFQVQAPEFCNFSTPAEWTRWKKKFERFSLISGLSKKDDTEQIEMLMYLMGDKADDVFLCLKFETDDDKKKIKKVLESFDAYFQVRKNVIFERARFHRRNQEEGESMDEFITSLFHLAQTCDFGTFHDEMIRDRLVVGVRELALSEKLQMDEKLTLDKAMKTVRQYEMIKKQQSEIRPGSPQLNQMKAGWKKKSYPNQSDSRDKCGQCGKIHFKGRPCPALKSTCNKCGVKGHWETCCPEKSTGAPAKGGGKNVSEVAATENEVVVEKQMYPDAFLLNVEATTGTDYWTETIQIEGNAIKIKLDTGADVTAIPYYFYKKKMPTKKLHEPDRKLRGSSGAELDCVGMFHAKLKFQDREHTEEIYVIRRMNEPLLSGRACEKLRLVTRLNIVDSPSSFTSVKPKEEFPELFDGLGKIGSPYKINLRSDAQPYAIHTLPVTDKRLAEIAVAQNRDPTLQRICKYIETKWPEKKQMTTDDLAYYHVRDELSVANGILMRGCRLVIPANMRNDILEKLHAGHFGITKTRLRARDTVWWPGIAERIAETVKRCSVCVQEGAIKHETMIASDFPTRPWQKLGMDLFKHEGKWFLVVIDYYSRYIEIAQLERLTAEVVVGCCKSIFARHGIPEVVMSDNGTQFGDPIRHCNPGAAREFSKFANDYGFTHVTSSPKYPQSNGMAEAGVKIAKKILKKSEDPSIGLLEYRTTPLENGFSPAELLMGRKLRSVVPVLSQNLNPTLVNPAEIQEKEEERKEKVKENYDKSHAAKDQDELIAGDVVWIVDLRTWGKVQEKAPTPRSYFVETPNGYVRRNRYHLRKGYGAAHPSGESGFDLPDCDLEDDSEEVNIPVEPAPQPQTNDGQRRTIRGRAVKPNSLYPSRDYVLS